MGIEDIRRIKDEAANPKPKKIYVIPKQSVKKKAKIEALKASGDSILDKWFEARRKEMTGRCALCNGMTEKHNDETYRRSIHHLFDKRRNMFPSIATHEDNWLEVCFFGNSCHTNIHNGTISWSMLRDSAGWSVIVEKFKKVYMYIAEEERRNIPEVFLPYVNGLIK
jgi:hypothetical protein